MTLSLWNKWRDQTYRNDRDAELQYLDQLPAISAANASSADKQSPAGARVKQSFTLVSEGTHTVSGNGKMAGQVLKCEFWACKKEGCARGNAKKKIISPYFTFTVVKGQRPALFSLFH